MDEFKIVKSGGGRSEDENRTDVLIKKASVVNSLPDYLAPGSTAFTADMSYIATKDLDGSWKQIGG